jgi:hypothetical protein
MDSWPAPIEAGPPSMENFFLLTPIPRSTESSGAKCSLGPTKEAPDLRLQPCHCYSKRGHLKSGLMYNGANLGTLLST